MHELLQVSGVVPYDGGMKSTPSVPSGAYPIADVLVMVMVGRILPNVHSCKKLRTPVYSGKIISFTVRWPLQTVRSS